MQGKKAERDVRQRWSYLIFFLLLIVAFSFLTRDPSTALNAPAPGFSAIEVNGLTSFIVSVSADSVGPGNSPSKVLMELVGKAQGVDSSLKVSSGVGKLVDERGRTIGYFLLMQQR